MTRTPKTPQQRATEALAVSERKVSRLKSKRDALAKEVKALEAAIVEEDKQHAYLAQNPALRGEATQVPTQGGAQSGGTTDD